MKSLYLIYFLNYKNYNPDTGVEFIVFILTACIINVIYLLYKNYDIISYKKILFTIQTIFKK